VFRELKIWDLAKKEGTEFLNMEERIAWVIEELANSFTHGLPSQQGSPLPSSFLLPNFSFPVFTFLLDNN
jgi:hypothetical protein